MKRSPRTPVKLPESTHHQLNMYALAACAAGVSLLALANPAQARIVYTRAHHKLPINKDFFLDVNHDRIKDFKFHLQDFLLTASDLRRNELSTFRTRTKYGASYACARALNPGVKVGPKSPFKRLSFRATMGLSSTLYPRCSWQKVGGEEGYLALKFSVKGKIHYGWARFGDIYLADPEPSAILTGYAYETIPNKPIFTGQTEGPDVIKLEPGSLGGLAQGSRDFAASRRKESASGTH